MTTEEDRPTSTTNRRFLTLPASRPCTEAVSAQSLLRATVAIAEEITSKSPSSQRFRLQTIRRGAVRAIQVARLLLAFLEELHLQQQTDDLLLPSLSELYVAFQKLRTLLQDCSLPEASIFLLMTAYRADREFRAFHESVATAVDSLLLASNEADVAELAELAASQARRAARDGVATAAADIADEKAALDARTILTRFERGVAPRRVAVRRLMDHLRVRTWADCDAEVAFLEAQIGLAAADSESSAASLDLLQGLRGLMLYARAVLFDAAESTTPTRPAGTTDESQSATREFAWLDPEGLRCPISLDLMTDPVTVSTGQTYNRPSISRWLRAGNHTCPVTGKDLRGGPSTEGSHLVPNLAVRSVIQRFCQARRVKVPDLHDSQTKTVAPARSNSPNKAATSAMRLVAAHLVRQLSEGSSEARSSAAHEARLLAKSGAAARVALTEAGASPWLLHLLASWDKRIQDDAAAAVMNLSKHPEGRKEVFEAGGLVYLVDMLADDAGTSPDSQANAAGALFYLATAGEEYRLAIGETPGAVKGLVELLKRGTYRGKKHAVTAILALLASPANHSPAIKAGAIPTMIGLLATERDDIVSDAVAAVAVLAESPRGTRAVLADPSQVRSLAQVLRSSAPTVAKECCISVLTALCRNGGAETVAYLNRIPTLMTSLYSLLTESSPVASKKSSALIRILHGGHGRADDHLRFRRPVSQASHSPASPPQLAPQGNHVHVR